MVYLSGEHIPTIFDAWSGAPTINFGAFTDMMAAKNQNFLRLWVIDSPYGYHLDGTRGAITPVPFQRPGPGNAADGGLKFNLSQLNQSFFDQLRARVIEAGSKGIYVSVMLSCPLFMNNTSNWPYSMYNTANNINSVVAANTDQWTLNNSSWVGYFDAYADHVVDTLNDLDNVLFEVGNEGGYSARGWQEHVIDRIHAREAGMAKQHPVGKTAYGEGAVLGMPTDAQINTDLLGSHADWVSLSGREGEYTSNVTDAPATKVSILDTDHIVGFVDPSQETTFVQWVWKSLLRGHNPIYLTPQTGYPGGFTNLPSIENALGYARIVAKTVDLEHMTPNDGSASTGFALVNPNIEYLVYQPAGTNFTVTLPAKTFAYEWIRTSDAAITQSGNVSATSGNNSFTPPYSGAILHLGPIPPVITSVRRLSNGDILLQGTGGVNQVYMVKMSSSLTTTPQAIATITADANGNFQYEDVNSGSSAGRFYWVSLR